MILPSLRVLIVDDERVARARLRDLLVDLPGITIAGEASNGLDALGQVSSLAPDVILLDVQMPGLNGIEVARHLDSRHSPRVIFVTAYDRYAIEAFEVAAIDYLLKPVKLERLKGALDRLGPQEVRRLSGPPLRHVVVRYRNGLKVIREAEIISLEAKDKLAYVITKEGEFLSNFSLSELEQSVDPEVFLRVHRQHLVNLNHILELRPLINGAWQLIMTGGREVPVSRSWASTLKRRLRC